MLMVFKISPKSYCYIKRLISDKTSDVNCMTSLLSLKMHFNE